MKGASDSTFHYLIFVILRNTSTGFDSCFADLTLIGIQREGK